ncbi:MAG: BON domain-containing protein [Acidobacteriota bacterium]
MRIRTLPHALFLLCLLQIPAPAPSAAGAAAEPPVAAREAPTRRNIAGPGDYVLREKLVRIIGRDPELARQKIRLVLVNGGAVFSGEIGSCALRMRALRLAAFIRGVINVTDAMSVPPADLSDRALRNAVSGVLADAAEELGLEDLEVGVEDTVATLSGGVRDYRARVRAEELAGTVLGITRISNHLMPADAPRGDDDASIARAVKAYLEDFRAYPHGAEIEVRVAEGVVTLSGRVGLHISRQQAAVLAALVGGVEGVDSRVRVDPSFRWHRAVVKIAS